MITALNKYWRPLTMKEYLYNMDIPMTQNAVCIAQFPPEVEKWIWEIERKPFEVF